MTITRRGFLISSGAGALALAVSSSRLASARGLLLEATLEEVIGRALDTAKKAGATYADVRIHRRRSESVSTRDDHIDRTELTESYGMAVRVIAGGAWGHAGSSRVEAKEAERIALAAVAMAKADARALKGPITLAPAKPWVDVWQTPLEKDPFKIPIEEKAELLLAANAEALKVAGAKFCTSSLQLLGEWKLLVTSEGASIEQDVTRLEPQLLVTAVDPSAGEFAARRTEIPPRQAGWEYVESVRLVDGARQIAEDAVQKLKAASVTPGKRDLILSPSHLFLTIHETIGHATELDRALGYEADLAGTSYLTPELRGKFRLGSDLVNVYADKTTPGGLATCGYDDDGVKTQRWDLVKNGVWVGYQTTREQAGWIGEAESRGTAYAENFRHFAFQRMPNVSLAPGARDLSTADVIAATDDGIYISGNGSWSIDHQRKNFQFGGQMFYEIKKGKIARVLRDVAYQGNGPEFWASCDCVGGASAWELHGALGDGKGQPPQSNAVSHGCPPSRFKQVNILNTNTRKGA